MCVNEVEASHRPLVSIVLPTRNQHDFIDTAIRSVLSQSYRNIELVVVDDCSETPIDLRHFNDDRVRFVRNEVSLGGGASRNLGVENSRGNYICFLDDDDYYFPEKIDALLNVILSDSSISAVFGKTLRSSGKFMSCPLVAGDIRKIEDVKYLHTNSSLIRRAAFLKVGFCEQLSKFQDTQLHIGLINKCRVVFVDEFVAFWRDNYIGTRITDMRSSEKIMRSIRSYQALLCYMRQNNTPKSGYNYYYRSYLRHLARYWKYTSIEQKQLSLSSQVYCNFFRAIYLVIGRGG